jgi:pyrroloquinoline quinone biosynthesis protein D
MIAVTDTAKPGLAAKARLKWDATRGKNLLLFPEGVLVLNQTANEVLSLCDGQRTVAQIVQSLKERFGNDNIEADVKELLNRLSEKGLVVLSE